MVKCLRFYCESCTFPLSASFSVFTGGVFAGVTVGFGAVGVGVFTGLGGGVVVGAGVGWATFELVVGGVGLPVGVAAGLTFALTFAFGFTGPGTKTVPSCIKILFGLFGSTICPPCCI